MAAGTVRSAAGEAGQTGPSPASPAVASAARPSPASLLGPSTAASMAAPSSRRASGPASVLVLLSLLQPLHNATWSKLATTTRKIKEFVFIAWTERASRRIFPDQRHIARRWADTSTVGAPPQRPSGA